MREDLQEFCDSRGAALRVDRQSGVLRGVKILGLISRNGRKYLADALAKAASLYENAKVNVNHPKGSPLSPRDYQDRIGVIRNVAVRGGEGLYADFHFNPKHALAEQLAWDAEHAPENVGFSHNVEAVTSRNGEGVIVEEILKVQGVDLVADPATTRGLFEGAPADATQDADGQTHDPPALGDVTLEELQAARPDLVTEIRGRLETALAEARAELDRHRAEDTTHRRRVRVRQLLAEFHLPDPETGGTRARSVVSDAFLEMLMTAPSDEAARELVEERARLVEDARSGRLEYLGDPGRPRSRDQYQVDVTFKSDVTAESFVRAIT